MSDDGSFFDFLDEGAQDKAPRPIEAPDHRKEQDRESELWARARRKEMRRVVIFAAVVAAFAGWWFLVNAWVLWKVELPDLEIEIVGAPGLENVTYRAELVWNPAGADGVVRPDIVLDGRAMAAGPGGERPVLTVGRPTPISARVGPQVSRLDHRGSLELRRVGGEEQAPPRIEVPLRVEVIGGPWSRAWGIFQSGLAATVALVGLLYLLCLVLFPRPKGTLLIQDPARPGVPRKLSLGVRPLARAFPWLRSSVPLPWVARKTGVEALRPVGGMLLFHDSTLPLLVGIGGRRTVERTEAFGPALRVRREARFAEASPFELLTTSNVYQIRTGSSKEAVRFRYFTEDVLV